MLSEHRDMVVAKAFFRSAKSATGLVPDRVTTDGHSSYPRAIRSTRGRHVRRQSVPAWMAVAIDERMRGEEVLTLLGRFESMPDHLPAPPANWR
jgi:putative transposase